jgi:hypothetical protein
MTDKPQNMHQQAILPLQYFHRSQGFFVDKPESVFDFQI